MLELGALHPVVASYADYTLQLGQYLGLRPQLTSTYRSLQEQQRLYDAYLRGESRYPANRPGNSAHNYGLAWDSWVPDADMPLWTTVRRWIGWRVPDNDLIHAEVRGWRNFVQ